MFNRRGALLIVVVSALLGCAVEPRPTVLVMLERPAMPFRKVTLSLPPAEGHRH